jgi:hypothetical protein
MWPRPPIRWDKVHGEDDPAAPVVGCWSLTYFKRCICAMKHFPTTAAVALSVLLTLPAHAATFDWWRGSAANSVRLNSSKSGMPSRTATA